MNKKGSEIDNITAYAVDAEDCLDENKAGEVLLHAALNDEIEDKYGASQTVAHRLLVNVAKIQEDDSKEIVISKLQKTIELLKKMASNGVIILDDDITALKQNKDLWEVLLEVMNAISEYYNDIEEWSACQNHHSFRDCNSGLTTNQSLISAYGTGIGQLKDALSWVSDWKIDEDLAEVNDQASNTKMLSDIVRHLRKGVGELKSTKKG